MTDNSRERVVIALESGQSAQTVQELAETTGLHPNTVRSQLEVLVATGVAQRDTVSSTGRGRPKHVYRRVESAAPFRNLAEALTGQLRELADDSIVAETAGRWARLAGPTHDVSSADEAVELVTEELTGLGFTAQAGPIGDSILLNSCPYASLAAENPLICDIHAALVGRLLDATGQGVTLRSLEIEPRPGTCVIRLNRPDLSPQRVIETAGQEGH